MSNSVKNLELILNEDDAERVINEVGDISRLFNKAEYNPSDSRKDTINSFYKKNISTNKKITDAFFEDFNNCQEFFIDEHGQLQVDFKNVLKKYDVDEKAFMDKVHEEFSLAYSLIFDNQGKIKDYIVVHIKKNNAEILNNEQLNSQLLGAALQVLSADYVNKMDTDSEFFFSPNFGKFFNAQIMKALESDQEQVLFDFAKKKGSKWKTFFKGVGTVTGVGILAAKGAGIGAGIGFLVAGPVGAAIGSGVGAIATPVALGSVALVGYGLSALVNSARNKESKWSTFSKSVLTLGGIATISSLGAGIGATVGFFLGGPVGAAIGAGVGAVTAPAVTGVIAAVGSGISSLFKYFKNKKNSNNYSKLSQDSNPIDNEVQDKDKSLNSSIEFMVENMNVTQVVISNNNYNNDKNCDSDDNNDSEINDISNEIDINTDDIETYNTTLSNSF